MRGAPFFGPSRVILASFALASLLADAGCKKKEPPPEAKKEAVAPETAVPAPDGMVAEGIDEIARRDHGLAVTISPIIPDKAAPILADVLHVNRVVADEIDGQRPAFFVMARKGETSLYVFAAPIKDASKVGRRAREARDVAHGGQHARAVRVRGRHGPRRPAHAGARHPAQLPARGHERAGARRSLRPVRDAVAAPEAGADAGDRGDHPAVGGARRAARCLQGDD